MSQPSRRPVSFRDPAPSWRWLAQRLAAGAALLTLLAACAAPPAAAPARPPAAVPGAEPLVTAMSVSDGTTGGNPRFYWVVNKGLATFPGVLDTALQPSVRICRVVNNVVTTTCPVLISRAQLSLTPDDFTVSPPNFGFWRGRWNSKTPALSVNDDYRMSVLVGSQVIGYQDVDLVATSNETKTPRAGFIALVNGSSLDFKFRIEVGATGPNVSLTPASLAFGTVLVGQTSAPKTVSIKNVGVAALALSGAARSGPHAADFSATLSGCATLAPGASCTLSVTFRPAALGPRSATLTLMTPGGAVPQTLALAGGNAAQVINQPPRLPHAIIAFPVRDFVSAEGYAATDRVTVSVLRPDPADPTNASKYRLQSQARNITPQDDPATPEFDGLVEVNHPGGVCWETIVPDIRAGDVIRLETAPGVGDETYVQNVAVTTPATVQTAASSPVNADGAVVLRGRAMDLRTGRRLDLAQVEARLIAKGSLFARNGRRSLRAGAGAGDGTLSFDTTDPGNGAWTAVFAGLNASDLTLAVGAESRVLWLGRDPAAGSELTIYEYGQFPGFGGGCVGPVTGFAGPLAAPSPASLIFNEQGLYDPADPGANPASAPQTITVANGGGAPLTISDTTLDGSGAGDFLLDTNTCRGAVVAPGGSCTVGVRFRPTSGGVLDAVLRIVNDADNSPQSVVLTGNLNSVTPGPERDPPQDPHALVVFPSRDFVSAEGYGPADRVKVEVLRGGAVIGVANNVVPQDDPGAPGFDGLVEVNHPGGACWEGTTPDIRPGDVVRLTTNLGVVDRMTTQNLIIIQPATPGRAPDGSPAPSVIVKGSALGQDGVRLPLNQFEARLIAKGSLFPVNGRRSLRAGGLGGREGTLTYDTANPADGRWTAVFPGLSPADVELATGAETRGVWLGRNPAALTESTIYEFGLAGGPVGCAAPLSVPTLTATPSALDFAAVPLGTTSAARTVTLSASSPADISSLRVEGIDPGEFSVNPSGCPGNGRLSCTFSVTFSPAGPGVRTATVQIVGSANGSPHAVLLRGEGVAAPPPNRAPAALDDHASAHAGRMITLNVLANDTDADGDSLSVAATDPGQDGAVSCGASGDCTFTPEAGFLGTTHFAYTVQDTQGGSDNATVTLNFTNARPTPAADSALTGTGRPLTLDVLANDADEDRDPLSVSSFTQGASGSATCAGGSCTYTPNPGFVGTDSFTYSVSDGFETASTSVTVEVEPAPVASPDGPITITLGTFEPDVGAFIPAATLLANDTGRGLRITSANSSSGGSLSCDPTGCTFKSSGAGEVDFAYTVTDVYGNVSQPALVRLNFTAP